MFKNKYFLMLITFCLLFLTVSCVSAVENNTTNDLDNVSSIDDEAILKDSDKGTFSDLNKLINTDNTIKLDKDYKYDTNDSSFKDGITISKNLTIDGQGHTIDANHQARIFNIKHNNVVLKNIKFINGNKFTGDGGAIYYAYCSNCSIINSTFTNNTANSGGAIYYSYNSSNCSIINSTFTNNTAKDRYVGGGAIYYNNNCSNCSIINSTFTNNTANYEGGAINGDCSIINSTFNYNKANYEGGAIYGDCSIVNSEFNYNYYNDIFGKYTGTNNKFTGDSYFNFFINATKDNGIINLNNDLNATRPIQIIGNNVTINGNGFTINGQNKYRIFEISGINVTIKNIQLINGMNGRFGGAIYYHDGCSGGSIINSTFTNNTETYGGTIYYSNYCSNCSIINSTFTNNTAKDNYCSVSGGAIYYSNYCSNCSIINSTFTNNTADHGGAIYFYGDFYNYGNFNCYIVNSIFTNNKANEWGGAIYGDCSIINSTFTNNTAHFLNGGAIYGDCSIINSIFTNNKANYLGGAIFGDCSIINSIFTNNTSKVYGGAIYCYGCSIVNSIFTNNTATYNGGAIYNYNANAYVKDSTFINNKAEDGSIICQYIGYKYDYSDGETWSIGQDYNNKYHITFSLKGITIKNCTFIDPSHKTEVKKIKSTLTAKKTITFKAKKHIKKYSITLKANKKAIKKVKVYLKIGKKTIKTTTNNKGKATFKIKFLKKKGTYKAKITFKGNNKYYSTTKTVKIKVKK